MTTIEFISYYISHLFLRHIHIKWQRLPNFFSISEGIFSTLFFPLNHWQQFHRCLFLFIHNLGIYLCSLNRFVA